MSRAAMGAAVFSATRRALSELLPGLAEVPQQAYADARGAGARVVWRDVRLIAVGVGRPGDVEMHPRDVADELLEEQASGDGARAAAAAVADVGHGGLDLLAIDLPE